MQFRLQGRVCCCHELRTAHDGAGAAVHTSLAGVRAAQIRRRYDAAADELLELLCSSGGDAGGSTSRRSTSSSDRSSDSSSGAVQQLVAQLLTISEADRLPFKEQLLGGGPWLVLYTQGSAQLWKATYQAGKLVNAANAASQDLQPAGRLVINRAEYAGASLYVTASGSYTPLGVTGTLPQRVRADISSGLLHILGLDVPLPIRGSGEFAVVYLNKHLRVFRSGSAVTVQVRADYVAAAAAGQRRT